MRPPRWSSLVELAHRVQLPHRLAVLAALEVLADPAALEPIEFCSVLDAQFGSRVSVFQR